MNTVTDNKYELKKLFVKGKMTRLGREHMGLYVKHTLTERGNEIAVSYLENLAMMNAAARIYFERKYQSE